MGRNKMYYNNYSVIGCTITHCGSKVTQTSALWHTQGVGADLVSANRGAAINVVSSMLRISDAVHLTYATHKIDQVYNCLKKRPVLDVTQVTANRSPYIFRGDKYSINNVQGLFNKERLKTMMRSTDSILPAIPQSQLIYAQYMEYLPQPIIFPTTPYNDLDPNDADQGVLERNGDKVIVEWVVICFDRKDNIHQ